MRKHTFFLVDTARATPANKPMVTGAYRTGVWVSLYDRFMRNREEAWYSYVTNLGCAESFNDSVLMSVFKLDTPVVTVSGPNKAVETALLLLSRLAAAFRIKVPSYTVLPALPNDSGIVYALIPATRSAKECCVFWHLYTMVLKDQTATTILTSPEMENFTLPQMIAAINKDTAGRTGIDLERHLEYSALASWCRTHVVGVYTNPESYDDDFFAALKMESPDQWVYDWTKYHKMVNNLVPGAGRITGFFSFIATYSANRDYIKKALTNG